MKVLWTTWCKPKPLRQAHWRVETLTAAFPAGMIAGLQSRNFQYPDSIVTRARERDRLESLFTLLTESY